MKRNMMKVSKLIICLMIAFVLNGCFPYRFVTRPGATGYVIDSKTHKPVVTANVSLVTTFRDVKDEVATMTSDEGYFLLNPGRKWHVLIVPTDPARIQGDLSINADGYVNFRKTIYTNTMGKALFDLGTIEMEPKN